VKVNDKTPGKNDEEERNLITPKVARHQIKAEKNEGNRAKDLGKSIAVK